MMTTMTKEDKLNSLRLLFSESYSDQDLIFILEEAADDLDLAIARIAEGQAEQWDQVKNKRKEKPASTPPIRGRGAARGGRGAARGRGGRPNPSAKNTFKPKEDLKVEQKTTTVVNLVKEKENQSIANADRPVTAPVTTATVIQKKTLEFKLDSWSTSPAAPIGKTKASQKPIGSEAISRQTFTSTSNSHAKGTWAQLVKGPETVSVTLIKSTQKTPVSQSSDLPPKQTVQSAVSAIAPPPKQPSPVQHVASDPISAPGKPGNLPPGLLQANGTASNTTVRASTAPNVTLQKKTTSRADPAVVMPNASNLANVGVQFGSLRIGKEGPKEELVKVAPQTNNPIPPASNVGVIPPYPHGSYFPQQVPAGFGMVAGAADFSHLYGNEQLRAAASMGYYSDPYQNKGQPSQAAADSQATPSSNTAAQTPAVTQSVPVQQTQQQYPVPFGYYPYYMPNQYQSAPGGYPSYGQYVNKNVYPYSPNPPQGTVTPATTVAPSATKAPLNGYMFSNNATYGGYEEPLNYANAPSNANPSFQGFNSGFHGTTGVKSSGNPASGQQDFRNPNTNRNQRQTFQSNQSSQPANLNQSTTATEPAGYYNQQAQQYYVPPQQQFYGGYGSGQRNGQYWTGQS